MNWFGTEFWSAIVGAIVGASASAIPSFLLARRASKEVLERDAAKRDEDDRLAVYRIFALLDHLGNQLLGIRSHVEDMYTSLPFEDGEEYPVQRRLMPMVGLSEADLISFDDSDFYIFAKKGSANLISDIRLLVRRFNADIHSILAYGRQKSDIQTYGSEAQGFEPDDDGFVTLELTHEQYVKLNLMQRNAETLAVNILPGLVEDTQLAVQCGLQFNAWSSEHFGNECVPKLRFERAFVQFPDLKENLPDDLIY